MKKNDLVQVTITDQIRTGEGVGKSDGFPLFIKNAVIGDEILARVTKVNKKYGYGRLEKILRPSDFRISPVCPAFPRCGGCQLMSMSYEAQLAFKQKLVEDCLQRIGGFENLKAEPVIGMDSPLRYRNKAQYPVGMDDAGRPAAGFYAGRSHRIIPQKDCALSPALFGEITQAILDWMEENGITAYDEETKSGDIRHIFLRKGEKTGQTGVCLILGRKKMKAADALVKKLSAFPDIVSISYSVNTSGTNVIMTEEARSLYGPAYIEDVINGITYRISPNSFFQVNPSQTEKLYNTALAAAGLTGKETVWDVYCGIGSISLQLAKKAGMVYGVEIVPRAIKDAKENARINGLDNTEFYVGKAEEVLPKLYREEQIHADVIVVDPPRKGCETTVLDTISAMSPDRIVYVSCDPATLARDLRYLADKGWNPAFIQPVDMFPQTVHVETVVLMSRVEGK